MRDYRLFNGLHIQCGNTSKMKTTQEIDNVYVRFIHSGMKRYYNFTYEYCGVWRGAPTQSEKETESKKSKHKNSSAAIASLSDSLWVNASHA